MSCTKAYIFQNCDQIDFGKKYKASTFPSSEVVIWHYKTPSNVPWFEIQKESWCGNIVPVLNFTRKSSNLVPWHIWLSNKTNVLFTLRLLLESNYCEESLGSVLYSQYLIFCLKGLSPGVAIYSLLYTKKSAYSEILEQGDCGITP